MPDLVRTTVDTWLATDTPKMSVGGSTGDYASWRVGGTDTFVQIFGNTGTRPSDLQRLHALFTRAIELIETAIAEEGAS